MSDDNILSQVWKILESNAITTIGSIASIVGLVFTIYIFNNLKKIKNFYLFSARVPEQLGKYRESISSINKYYSEYPSSKESILFEITRVEVNLNWFRKKVNKNIRKEIDNGLKLIECLKRKDVQHPKDEVYSAYLSFSKINELLLSLIEDNKWEIQ